MFALDVCEGSAHIQHFDTAAVIKTVLALVAEQMYYLR
jgi:hypothetical protein